MSDQMRQIAMRIRELREISDLTVQEVASNVGVPEEEYARYESGLVDMPISLLLKLADLYNVDTTTILTGQSPRLSTCAVTRKDMGVPIVRASHYIYKNLAYNFSHRRIEPLLVVVPPDANPDMAPNSHPGQEFDYILEGRMRLMVGDQEILMREGDCAYYDSIYPHAMQAVGGEPCKFLAMVIPNP